MPLPRCHKCGSENAPNVDVCTTCGAHFDLAEEQAKVQTAAQPQANTYNAPTGPPRMRYTAHVPETDRRWRFNFFNFLYSLIVAAVVFGGGGYLFYNFYYVPLGPTQTTRDFCKAVANQNAQGLIQSLDKTSARWVSGMGQQDREMVWNFFKSMSQGFEEGKEYEVKFGKVSGNYAKVYVLPGPTPNENFKEENLPGDLKDGLPITLVKQDEKWKVDLISTYKKRAQTGF